MTPFQWTDDLVKEFMTQFWTLGSAEATPRKISEFKASKQPKQEWEIVKMRAQGCDWGGHPWGNDCDKAGCKIHSVKRLSDGEVFTVGEPIEYEGNSYRIRGFENKDEEMNVVLFNGLRGGLHAVQRPAGWITKENRDFLKQMGDEVMRKSELPPAANGKVPVWLTPEDLKQLHGLLSGMKALDTLKIFSNGPTNKG